MLHRSIGKPDDTAKLLSLASADEPLTSAPLSSPVARQAAAASVRWKLAAACCLQSRAADIMQVAMQARTGQAVRLTLSPEFCVENVLLSLPKN